MNVIASSSPVRVSPRGAQFTYATMRRYQALVLPLDRVSGPVLAWAIRERDEVRLRYLLERGGCFCWSELCERGDSNSHALSGTGS